MLKFTGLIHYHRLSPILPSITDRDKKLNLEVIISHIILLAIICMYWPLEMLWEWIPRCLFLIQYNEFFMPLLLYYHPYWADMNHQKPQLYFLYLFVLQSIIFLIFLLYYPISVFITNISICIIDTVTLWYMYQRSLLILGTSYNNLFSCL